MIFPQFWKACWMLGTGLWLLPAGAADTVRCGSRIVAVEAEMIEVLERCGEPQFRDPWYLTSQYGRGYVADTEEWYYNRGPSQLIRVMRFERSRLVDIDTDGHGFVPRRGGACQPIELVEGLSKYRLLDLCGEPATREALSVLRPVEPDDRSFGHTRLLIQQQGEYFEPVFRERWVYNFGAGNFLRIVTIENGRITDVEKGNRGFERR